MRRRDGEICEKKEREKTLKKTHYLWSEKYSFLVINAQEKFHDVLSSDSADSLCVTDIQWTVRVRAMVYYFNLASTELLLIAVELRCD